MNLCFLITKLTRITYDTATLIDTIYISNAFTGNFAFDTNLIDHLDCVLSNYIKQNLNNTCSERAIKLGKKRILRQPWMMRGLLNSSARCNKLYKKLLENIN